MNVALRKEFDLYANVRPALSLVGSRRHYDNLDLVLVRENTEGLYIGIEHYIPSGDDPHAAAESVAMITRYGSNRIVRYAFEYAVAARSQEGDARPQGEHPQVLAGAVPRRGPRDREASTRAASRSRSASSTRWR